MMTLYINVTRQAISTTSKVFFCTVNFFRFRPKAGGDHFLPSFVRNSFPCKPFFFYILVSIIDASYSHPTFPMTPSHVAFNNGVIT